jgi:hypothetical protein
MYEYLKNNMIWEEGVKSKGRHTRLAHHSSFGEDKKLDSLVFNTMKKFKMPIGVEHFGMYLNYQRDGNEYTPQHAHAGGCQLVICLGPAIRTFNVGKKIIKVGNGDCILFGSSTHGVIQEPDIKEGRISIATFSLFT